MPLGDDNSYMPAITDLEHTCNAYSFSVVVIERQLRHVNFQTGRIEANLEAYFTARNCVVHLMPADHKHAFHGLQLPLRLRAAFANREEQALQRAQAKAKTRLSKPQQTRLSKFNAMDLAAFFLEIRAQPAYIQAAYDSAPKRGDMADALLQALAYATVGVDIEGVYQSEVIDLLEY